MSNHPEFKLTFADNEWQVFVDGTMVHSFPQFKDACKFLSEVYG